MDLKIAICDDEPILIQELAERIEEYGKGKDLEFNITEFSLGAELLEQLEEFDIVILDICMPEVNGIEIAEKIREKGMITELVFYSSHPEFAIDDYHVNASGFIVKGDTKERFEREFEHVLDKYAEKNYKIELETSEGIVFRNIYDLLCIKYAERELTYFWKDGTKSVLRGSMKKVQKYVTEKKLIQISQTAMVNPVWIERCFSYEITLCNMEEKLKVSRRHWKNAEQEYINYNRKFVK